MVTARRAHGAVATARFEVREGAGGDTASHFAERESLDVVVAAENSVELVAVAGVPIEIRILPLNVGCQQREGARALLIDAN
jgi:hypothetical protein